MHRDIAPVHAPQRHGHSHVGHGPGGDARRKQQRARIAIARQPVQQRQYGRGERHPMFTLACRPTITVRITGDQGEKAF